MEAKSEEKTLKSFIGLNQNVTGNILNQLLGDLKAKLELMSDAQREMLPVRCSFMSYV